MTLGALLREAASVGLDAGLFSATAASSSRPAGLLAGVSAISATAGGVQAALIADLRALVGAIADAGGGSNIWIFAHPETAIALRLLAGVDLDVPVIGTPALAAGTVVAVDVAGLAVAFDTEPEISIARAAAVHFEDAAPQGLGESGSPTLPIRSFWQQDLIGIRLVLRCSWVMRSPGLVQFVENATW